MARYRHGRGVVGLLVALAASGSLATAGAQPRPQIGPRFMVSTLRSSEPGLGVQAAEIIRNRLTSDIPQRDLLVVPKTDINNALQMSGYSTTEALNANDTRALANIVHAAEYLDALVTHDANGYKIESNLVLAGQADMVQPLPPVQGAKLDDAVKALSKEIQSARKQVDDVQKCNLALRQRQYPQATEAAQKALRDYPQSSMARVCMLNIALEQKASNDDIIKAAEDVLSVSPNSKAALQAAANAYRAKGNSDKSVELLTRLLAVDPTNVRLQMDVVNLLGSTGKAALAKPIIAEAVRQNPGDPQLLRLQWLVLLASNDYKAAVQAGEELARADTSVADTTFFFKLAGAYAADSQPAKAAEVLARATQKFPNNASLWMTYAQSLSTAGQNDQAIAAIQKALAVDPKAPKANLVLAQLYTATNQPDKAMEAIRAARAAGDSAQLVAALALGVGNSVYQAASKTKARPDLEKAISILAFSDSVKASPQAKFLTGVSQLYLGQALLTEASQQKSCAPAKQAQDVLTNAQINLPQGGAFAPDAAKQALGALAQLSPAADQMAKALCKGGRGR